jgi:subtilisin family serine protease
MRRSWGWLIIGLTSMLMSLGCSGMFGDLQDKVTAMNETTTSPKGLKHHDRGIRRAPKQRRGPTSEALRGAERKNLFIVKLREGVTDLTFPNGQSVRTKKRDLDAAFDSLEVKEAGSMLKSKAKNEKAARVLGLDRLLRIRTARSKEKVLEKLEDHPDVEWVEPVSQVAANAVPNDPYWEHQWHLHSLRVDRAWETTRGRGVVVAVIDTGVSSNEDGFYRLEKGYDFVDGDTQPQDENGHGTHVAGTIGQRTGNGIGVAGVAPEVTILPVRVLDAAGMGSSSDVANGVVWAVDHGADIINMSLGGSSDSAALASACAYAYEQGVTVIAATGNDGFTSHIGYPAAYGTTIAVGAVDRNREVAFYSNQGKGIDLVGPGGDTSAGMAGGIVQETRMGGTWGYYFLQGTSMATPHVSGVAALLHASGVREPDAIRSVLHASSQDLGSSGWDAASGHGMVDPVAALSQPKPRSKQGFEMVRHRVVPVGQRRAVIQWMTSKPATTLARGGGEKRVEKEATRTHRVTVSGSPGKTVEYTIASQAGGKTVSEKVNVTFGGPRR